MTCVLLQSAKQLDGEIAEILARLTGILCTIRARLRVEMRGCLQRASPEHRLFKTIIVGVLPQPTIEVIVRHGMLLLHVDNDPQRFGKTNMKVALPKLTKKL